MFTTTLTILATWLTLAWLNSSRSAGTISSA
jgi:hypothetical protein